MKDDYHSSIVMAMMMATMTVISINLMLKLMMILRGMAIMLVVMIIIMTKTMISLMTLMASISITKTEKSVMTLIMGETGIVEQWEAAQPLALVTAPGPSPPTRPRPKGLLPSRESLRFAAKKAPHLIGFLQFHR